MLSLACTIGADIHPCLGMGIGARTEHSATTSSKEMPLGYQASAYKTIKALQVTFNQGATVNHCKSGIRRLAFSLLAQEKLSSKTTESALSILRYTRSGNALIRPMQSSCRTLQRPSYRYWIRDSLAGYNTGLYFSLSMCMSLRDVLSTRFCG